MQATCGKMSTAFTLWEIVVSYFSHLEPLVSPHTDLELLAAIEGNKTEAEEIEELIQTLEQQINKKDKKHGRHDGLK